jgi:hypothetical protein
MKTRRPPILALLAVTACVALASTGCGRKPEGHAKFTPGQSVAYNVDNNGHARKGTLAVPPP